MTTKKKTKKTRGPKPFNRMSPVEKRITIAQDVLAQLATNRLIAKHRVWVSNPGSDPDNDDDTSNHLFETKNLNAGVETLFGTKTKKKACEVCAMGAMFVCAVERADKLKVKDLKVKTYTDKDGYRFESVNNSASELKQMKAKFKGVEIVNEDVFAYMGRFFDQDQLEDIETAFEGGHGAKNTGEEASLFADCVDEPSEKMRLIMENIVANKGVFVKSQRPVRSEVYQTRGYNQGVYVPPIG